MNPLVVEALGSIIRWALSLGAGYLVARGIWTNEAAATYVPALSLAIISLGWSIWQHSKMRTKLLVALGLSGTTENEVQKLVADPNVPNPSVTTPKDAVPKTLPASQLPPVSQPPVEKLPPLPQNPPPPEEKD